MNIYKNQPKGKRERTKTKIFKTAVDLFLEKGYDNTTVQEITERAEVAKGTFFSHFPTKDAILTYLGEQRIELLKDNMVKDLQDISNAKMQILKLFDFMAEANEKDKKITQLISFEIMKKLNSDEIAHESENQLELQGILEGILNKGQQKGEFKKDFSPSHVADILIGIYFFTLLKWLKDDNPISLAKEYSDRVSIVLGGISVEE